MKFITKYFRRSDVLFIVFAICVVALYVKVANGGFPLDDSWIHQVYGRNLAETGQWAFIPGVPSAASTSPLYTVLLAFGYKLNLSYKLWTYFLGILSLSVTGMVSARLAQRMLPQNRIIGVISGLAQIAAWHLVWAAASGMETMLFGMWTLVLIWLAWRELDAHLPSSRSAFGRGVLFGVCVALATMTRPEGIALAALIGTVMLIARPQASFALFLNWGIGATVAFLVAITPYLALNLHLTGGLLPDTAAAKQAENAPLLTESYFERLIKMTLPLVAGAQLFLLPGAVYYLNAELRRIRLDFRSLFKLLPILWGGSLIALYAARLPAYYQHGRYVIPALPAFILVGVVGSVWLLKQYNRSTMGRVITRALAISAIFAYVYFLVQGSVIYRQDVSIIDEEMVASANWIRENISPDAILAVHDIGAVGYFAPRRILDLAGLVSPEIVPFILDEEPLWHWLQDKHAQYLMAFPDQIPGDDPNNQHLCPIFTTGGEAAIRAGGPNMTVYALTWDGNCPQG
ncbi:MAG: hypothetical protein R3E39_05350 [Anaerolineae bacterium]